MQHILTRGQILLDRNVHILIASLLKLICNPITPPIENIAPGISLMLITSQFIVCKVLILLFGPQHNISSKWIKTSGFREGKVTLDSTGGIS